MDQNIPGALRNPKLVFKQIEAIGGHMSGVQTKDVGLIQWGHEIS